MSAANDAIWAAKTRQGRWNGKVNMQVDAVAEWNALAARAEAAERERDELRRTLDMGFVEVRDRMQAAEAKLAAIRKAAHSRKSSELSLLEILRIMDGSGT